MTIFSKPKAPVTPAPCAICGATEDTTRIHFVVPPESAQTAAQTASQAVWLCPRCLDRLRRGAEGN